MVDSQFIPLIISLSTTAVAELFGLKTGSVGQVESVYIFPFTIPYLIAVFRGADATPNQPPRLLKIFLDTRLSFCLEILTIFIPNYAFSSSS